MSSSLQKSTIVRIRNGSTRALFRAGELLAPRVGGRAVRNLWFTVPPLAPDAPLPPGGEPFTVTSLGAEVRGHVWGEGPVVYLVHVWAGRGSQLAGLVEPLTAAGFRAVLFDAPAHGASEPGPAGPGRTHGVEMGKALDAVAARFGPAHTVVAHSLGTIATYLAIRHGWLGTSRLVLLAPVVEAESLVDQFQRYLGFGPRTRRAFERDAHALVGLPISEFDARFQAAHADLVTTEGLGHRRILRDPGVLGTVVAFIRDERESAVA